MEYIPYTIDGPVKIIIKKLMCIKSLYCLSISSKKCYDLFWIKDYQIISLILSCRKNPSIIKNIIGSKNKNWINILTSNALKEIVRANGNSIRNIPFKISKHKPFIDIDLVKLALKQRPHLYHYINNIYIKTKHFRRYRYLILKNKNKNCINKSNVLFLSNQINTNYYKCNCINCQLINKKSKYVKPFFCNFELACIAVKRRGKLYNSIQRFLCTEYLALLAVRNNGMNIKYLNLPSYDNNVSKKLVLEAVKSNGGSIKYVPENLKTDNLMNIAMTSSKIAYKYITNSFKTNYNKMLKCIEVQPYVFYYIDNSLKNNTKFILDVFKIIKNKGKNIPCILDTCNNEILNNDKLVLEIFINNPIEYKNLPPKFIENILIYKYAQYHWNLAYKYTTFDIKSNFNIAKKAIMDNGNNIMEVPLELKNNKVLIKLALHDKDLHVTTLNYIK